MLRRNQALTSFLLLVLLAAGPCVSPVSGQQDAALRSLDGGSVALSSLRGKVVVLLFSGIQDPQCRD
ncbi:MAG TPA: hypothetical protein VFV34_15845, partial [Blastocatellia bacterium]|nr:hypothetical protein [Blastocatellia bacterium]